jgi:hypothetical protein
MQMTEQNEDELEITPVIEICPRHGTRIRQYFGCPRCVIEEVRRHEKRMDAALEREGAAAGFHSQESTL